MPPLSRSAVDRAGQRIRQRVRSGMAPDETDLAILDAFRAEYVPLVVEVHNLLREFERITREGTPWEERRTALARQGIPEELVLDVASRPKTSDAIVAKLARESTRLSQMQDIAGGRIILPDPVLQDVLRDAIVDAFEEHGETVLRVTDTRATGDEHGYRAIHIVLEMEGRPVEIQLRTAGQQGWAQIVERLDQAFGSDLKHGGGPERVRAWLRDLSDLFHEGETLQITPDELEARLESLPNVLELPDILF